MRSRMHQTTGNKPIQRLAKANDAVVRTLSHAATLRITKQATSRPLFLATTEVQTSESGEALSPPSLTSRTTAGGRSMSTAKHVLIIVQNLPVPLDRRV